MRLVDLAWRNVDTTTIRNCWRKAGILPDMPEEPLVQPVIPVSALLNAPAEVQPHVDAEKEVVLALDKLVQRGVLHKSNRMDIESLLNPAGESHVLTETTDQEIYEAVVNAIHARENIEVNGGDDVDDDVNVVLTPPPTQYEVRTATAVIERYIKSMNEPLARKLEVLLGSFNRQLRLDETQAMKSTVLTDFFKKA